MLNVAILVRMVQSSDHHRRAETDSDPKLFKFYSFLYNILLHDAEVFIFGFGVVLVGRGFL
jgi:hypothetical protein